MTFTVGRRLGPSTRPPRGTGLGAIPYVDANGLLAWLPVPTDWADVIAAGNHYELVVIDGIPAWFVDTETGGAAPVTVDDGSGGFVLVFDSDGNVVYA